MVGTITAGKMTIPVIMANFIVFTVVLAFSIVAFHFSVKPKEGEG